MLASLAEPDVLYDFLDHQMLLITLESLPIVLLNSPAQAEHSQSDSVAALPANTQKPMLISKDSLAAAIENFGCHRESIANYFGISRMTLWRKMK